MEVYNKRIALDIDGVICDFAGAYSKRLGLIDKGNPAWYMSYLAKDKEIWDVIVEDHDFWLGLEPLIDPNSLIFEPCCYITARPTPIWVIEQWLEANGFPCNDVVVVKSNGGEHESKVGMMKKHKVDIFVDDHYKNFMEVNNGGITCFLQDAFHNRRFPVGPMRIFHPSEAIYRDLYMTLDAK